MVSTVTRPSPTASTAQRMRRGVDAWRWFALVVGGLFWVGTTRPLGDPDIWWHVRTGQLVLDSGVPHEEPWAFTALGRPWVPTAWFSDVVLATVHDVAGWRGIVVAKVLVSAVVLLVLARQLFSVASSRIAGPVFALAAITLSPFLAERPQLVSLLLTVWLVGAARKALEGRPPPWWTVAVGYVWANLHGMWVLVPLAFGVVAVGAALDRGPAWLAVSRRSGLVAVAVVVSAALTPAGPRLAYWSLVVRDAASGISEWQPTVLVDRYSLAFTVLFLLWAVGLARAAARAPRSEVLWMSAVFLFSLQAGRNVAPAVILMAPFAAFALERAYGERLAGLTVPRVPRALVGATVVVAVAAATLLVVSRPPVVDGVPFRIVAALKERPAPVRVLNSYNVGGVLTGLGAPHVSVAIDGRTDNFDPDFVHRYLAATGDLVEWREVVREVDADYAVLGKDGPLATELRRAGWARELTDGDFVLLRSPTVPGA
jgi:hypothetical protein